MLNAQSLGAAVSLDGVKDGLRGACLARPKRIPSLGSLLEVSVSEELLIGSASRVGRRRQPPVNGVGSTPYCCLSPDSSAL